MSDRLQEAGEQGAGEQGARGLEITLHYSILVNSLGSFALPKGFLWIFFPAPFPLFQTLCSGLIFYALRPRGTGHCAKTSLYNSSN